MSRLFEFNRQPNDRQLRQFGVACLIVVPLVAWKIGVGLPVIGFASIGAIVLAAVTLARPAAIKPIFLTLSIVALPIGVVFGEAIMLTIYFGVFVPIGLYMRLIKRDALKLKFDPSAISYWRRKRHPADVSSYYRQS